MSELKLCPFCGGECELQEIQFAFDLKQYAKHPYNDCILGSFRLVPISLWQSRPIEDALQAKIDFVENKADQFNEGFQAARNGEPDRPIELEESNAWMEGYAYGAYLPMKQRITELESQLRWIPVSEPPAESMYVLICNVGDEHTNPALYATDICGFYWCRNGNWYTLEEWNTRPLEDALQKRIDELESENKALRLIAGSHSMSELRRLQMQTGWFKYPPADEVMG